MSIVEADQTPSDLPTAPAFCSVLGRAGGSKGNAVIALLHLVSCGSATSKAVVRTDVPEEEKECSHSILFHWEK